MTEFLNEKILEKLEELTDNVNELQMCKKILYLENLNSNDEGYDFKPQYKKYLNVYFPYEEES
ncbi:MAG: hypothetical protein HOD60_07805 [Candidatus Nitrosopelagicus sp.]|nr:hypothetical protein [Candidatus Nitrosopelagicus sp.]